MAQTITHAKSYRSVCIDAVLVQAGILVPMTLAYDTGFLMSCALIAMAAYWAGLILYMNRYPRTPTRGALFRLRWGYIPLYLLTMLVVGCIQR